MSVPAPSRSQALRMASAALADVSGTPRLDAELLLAHALGISREALLLSDERSPAPAAFADLLARRLAHEPVAYIVGTRDFWTLTLRVTPAVLIPRPDSETLIDAAIRHCADRAPARVLDLGTGSGALLLAALDHWRAATGVGVDRSIAALAVAEDNARATGLAARARFVAGDWAAAADRYDLILCNPPYVAEGDALPAEVVGHEPAEALFAGADGLDDYRAIAPLLPHRLAPGGLAVLEIGATQATAVRALLAGKGLTSVVERDLAGRDRCLVAHAHSP